MTDATAPNVDNVEVPAPRSRGQQVADQLKEQFGNVIGDVIERLGETTIMVKRERIVEVCRFMRDDAKLRFNLLSDLTGVDRGLEAEPRFEVNYQLTSLSNRLQVRLKVLVGEDDPVATVTGVWKTANWHERETFDLFGIRFDGHPDLRKILTPDDLEGHPLRKDFPLRGY